MTCTKTVKEYSEAAGRKVEFCRELDGVADGTLGGFGLGRLRGATMEGGKVKWWVGGVAGIGAAGLGSYIGNYYYLNGTTGTTMMAQTEENFRGLGAAIGTAIASLPMLIFKKTRTAGLTALGTGAATTLGVYLYAKSASGTTTTVKGLPVAEMGRSPIQVLTGGGQMGLPVAEELSGAPVQVLTGTGAFGSSIGSNFMRR